MDLRPTEVPLGYTDAEHAVFEVTDDKKEERPVTFLNGFQGVFLPDGASIFNAACSPNGVVRAGCWSHARRKFFDARNDDPRAMQAIHKIRMLFLKERAAWLVSEEERQRMRNDFSAEWATAFRAWVDEHLPSVEPGTRLYKAMRYIINQWESLTTFLAYPNIPIHNNTSERSLRGPVVGRKNWMFAGSDAGAEAAAVHYSIVTSCMMVGIDPRDYLRDVLPRLPDATPTTLKKLTPKVWAERHRD